MINDDDDRPLLADGFEEALIGFATPWQNQHKKVAVYNRSKCIEILMDRDGMSDTDAEEFFEFNTEGAYVGEQTPIFVDTDIENVLRGE